MEMTVTNAALHSYTDILARAVPAADRLPRARMAAFDIANEWGLPDLADDAEIITSELLSNALANSKEAPLLALVRQENGLIIAVWDDSPEMPVRKAADAFDEEGRGLHIIAALSTEWGCYASDTGRKAVWARLKL